MEMLQLKYFCHAAKTENFSHTAAKFNVPPSNISQSIKRLEAELGVKLFNRSHNSIVLNDTGHSVYLRASKALELIDDIKSDIKKGEKKESLSVCALTNRQLIMRATEKFHTLYPETTVVISHNFNPDTDYDIIISDGDFPQNGKQRQLIVTEDIGLAVNLKNPLSKKKKISAKDLENENFIGLNEESIMHKTAEKICTKLKLNPNVIIRSPDPFYVRKCIELNLGVAFVPLFSWQGQFSDNIIIKNIGNFKRKTYAYTDMVFPKSSAEVLISLLK